MEFSTVVFLMFVVPFSEFRVGSTFEFRGPFKRNVFVMFWAGYLNLHVKQHITLIFILCTQLISFYIIVNSV